MNVAHCPNHRRKVRTSLMAVVTAVVGLMLATLVSINPVDANQSDLAEVRRATAKYHDLETALADGYQLGYRGIITGCIEHPTNGAMGYHYFNWDLIDEPGVHPLEPEGLVYIPKPNGGVRLAAVEWVDPEERPDRPGVTSGAVLFGGQLELHILNPALGWYIGHAWIWDPNPSGMFSDWNPDVVCPEGSGAPPPTNP